MVTIVQALKQLGDIDLMSVQDSQFVAEMQRKGFELWTFDDVRKVLNLWNKFVEPVKR